MIDHIDAWLDHWARWARQRGARQGYPTRSPIHRMMTEGRDRTDARGHTRARHVVTLADGNGARVVVRDLSPPPCAQTRSRRLYDEIPDDPMAEAMEDAIAQLRQPAYRDAIKIKYVQGWSNPVAAKLMRVSVARYKTLIDIAHESLDTYLRAVRPADYRRAILAARQ